jgi:hypothetical protein
MKTEEQSILFSGRFDKPHLSHFLTIRDLSRKYKKVLVVVLDYPKSFYSLSMRMHILKESLQDYDNIEIISNTTHFAEITDNELRGYGCDVYGAGNEAVLKHVESLGFPCVYVPRTLDTAASEDVKYQKIRKVLEG